MMDDYKQYSNNSEFCFVCDETIEDDGICLRNEKTVVSKTVFPNKISHLVGESYMVIISEDDKLCLRCVSLVNKFDELEAMLLEVKHTIVTFLINKYNLDEGELEKQKNDTTETLGSEEEINMNQPSFQSTDQLESLNILSPEFSQEVATTDREPTSISDHSLSDSEPYQDEVVIKCETCSNTKSNKEYKNSCCQHIQDVRSPEINLVQSGTCEKDTNSVERNIKLKEVKIEHNDSDETYEPLEHHSLCKKLEYTYSEKPSSDGKSQNVTKVETVNLDDTLPMSTISNLVNVPKPAEATKVIRRCSKQKPNFRPKLRPILPKITSLNDLANVISMDTQAEVKREGKLNVLTSKFKVKLQNNKVQKKDKRELNTTCCKICRTDFETLERLQMHEKTHFNGSNNLTCSFCGKIFKTFSGIRDHTVNRHTKKFSYYCDFCGRGFTTRARLEDHRSSHTHESRWVCDICGKRFNHQSTYWIHKKWHTEPLPYQCDACGRKFKQSSLLAVHKRSHTGERPYKCTYCSLTFTSSSSCKRHTILHTRKYPFQCQTCRVGFTTRFKYTSHMAKSHGNLVVKQTVGKKDFKMAVYKDELQVEESSAMCQIVQDDRSNSTASIYKYAYLEDSTPNNSEDLRDDTVEIILKPLESKSLLRDGLLTQVWLE